MGVMVMTGVGNLGHLHPATQDRNPTALGQTAGILHDLLGELDTGLGFALYLDVWVLSWWMTREVLTKVLPTQIIEAGGKWPALKWGLLDRVSEARTGPGDRSEVD